MLRQVHRYVPFPVSKQLDENTRVQAAKIAQEIGELRESLLENRTKLYGLMLNT